MSDVPKWLGPLIDVVAAAMTTRAAAAPLGVRYRKEEGAWEVLVYPLPVELVGGADDGRVVSPGFDLDLEQVRSAFARVDALSWNAHATSPEDEAPYVAFEGEYAGREVWLRVLAFAPEDEKPGAKIDATGR